MVEEVLIGRNGGHGYFIRGPKGYLHRDGTWHYSMAADGGGAESALQNYFKTHEEAELFLRQQSLVDDVLNEWDALQAKPVDHVFLREFA